MTKTWMMCLGLAVALCGACAGNPDDYEQEVDMQSKLEELSLRVTGYRAPPRKADGSYGGKNIASAWTAACYAEFGPNASNPDAKMLQWCLDF